MKQPIEKHLNNLGHNNPPVTIKSIDLINLKIYNIEILK